MMTFEKRPLDPDSNIKVINNLGKGYELSTRAEITSRI